VEPQPARRSGERRIRPVTAETVYLPVEGVVGPFRVLAELDPARARASLWIGPVGQGHDRIERQHVDTDRRARGRRRCRCGCGCRCRAIGIDDLGKHCARHNPRGDEAGGLQHGLSAIHLGPSSRCLPAPRYAMDVRPGDKAVMLASFSAARMTKSYGSPSDGASTSPLGDTLSRAALHESRA
jgi:hypothetical protein